MSQDLSILNLSLDTIARLQYLYREIDNTVRLAQQYSHAISLRPAAPMNPSVPMKPTAPMNPNAPEFVSSTTVTKKHDVQLEDVLLDGEVVYLTMSIGRHADGYPILTSAVCDYYKGRLTIHACADVPYLIGKSSEKPGALLYQFIRGLRRTGLLKKEVMPAVWKHCYVKRDGKHISLYRLANRFRCVAEE